MMVDGKESGASPAASDYWSESRRPLASLLFVAPLLIVYEGGVILLGPQAVRNGVDIWLRGLLGLMSFGQYFLLPLLTVCLLLAWHHTTRRPWWVARGVVAGMAVESLVLAAFLWLLLQLQMLIFGGLAGSLRRLAGPAAALSGGGPIGYFVGFLGAGIYEELLFRLVLLSAIVWAFRGLGARPRTGILGAILVTSLLFAAAHYVGSHGDPIDWRHFNFWFGFLFRLMAGAFFSVLFVCRGFGIAAGAHAGYDILIAACGFFPG
jgi:membrane protease YdiL (CAAX protease family)